MRIYVTIDSSNNVVGVWSIPKPAGDLASDVFPNNPEFTDTLIDASGYPDVSSGWVGTKKNSKWSFAESPAYLAKINIAKISAERFVRETAGIVVSGAAIDTDRESQGLINGAALSAVIDSGYVCRWKTVDGMVSLTAPQLIAIATAVRAHVQACFDREGVLLAAVADQSYTDAMLSEGWPG